MKKNILTRIILTFIIFAFTSALLLADQGGGYNRNVNNRRFDRKNVTPVKNTQISKIINDIPKKELDSVEITGILQMREEEKLARDVYQYLYEKWNLPIFSNIAKAEATHMKAVGLLISRYNLKDPIKSDIPGKYTSTEIQKLYNDLTSEGSKSLIDALKIGATIEDLDIKDLEEFISKTDNDDIKIVFQNLNKGSRNHLRAFYSQLKKNGADYKAQFISENHLLKIVNSSRERGIVIKNPNFKF